jgi:hypothetical protein
MNSFHELAALPVSAKEGMVKALSEKSLAWITYCPSMRPSGLRSTWARLRLLLPTGVMLSCSEGLSRGHRDASLRLSMTL